MNNSANDQQELLDAHGLLTSLLFFTDGLLSFRTEKVILFDVQIILIRPTVRLILISDVVPSHICFFFLLLNFEFE